jgi:hypothetical protein
MINNVHKVMQNFVQLHMYRYCVRKELLSSFEYITSHCLKGVFLINFFKNIFLGLGLGFPFPTCHYHEFFCGYFSCYIAYGFSYDCFPC